jgi:hypothetical protein
VVWCTHLQNRFCEMNCFLLYSRRDFYSKMLSGRPEYDFKYLTQISMSNCQQYFPTLNDHGFLQLGPLQATAILHQLSIKYIIPACLFLVHLIMKSLAATEKTQRVLRIFLDFQFAYFTTSQWSWAKNTLVF